MWRKDISQFLKQINDDVTRTTAVHTGTPVSVLSYTSADDCLLHRKQCTRATPWWCVGARGQCSTKSTSAADRCLWCDPPAAPFGCIPQQTRTRSEEKNAYPSLESTPGHPAGSRITDWACQWINTTTIERPHSPYIPLPVLQLTVTILHKHVKNCHC